MKSKTLIALGIITTTSMAAHAGGTFNWVNALDGDWGVGFNWNTGLIPGVTDSVEMGLVDGYTVSVIGGQSAGTLSISNPGAVLAIQNTATFNMFGDLMNSGLILVNATGGGSSTNIDMEVDMVLSGPGTLRLVAPATRSRIRGTVGSVMTQGPMHTIEGQGRIETSMMNNGLVRANVMGAQLELNTNDKANNGIFQAVNSGILEISSITMTQSATGDIVADGAGSQVELISATIIGGDLISMNGGDIELSGTTTLDAVSFSGDLNILNGTTVHFVNSWTNNGVVHLNSTAGGSTTTLDVDTSLAFSGTGTLDLVAPSTRSRLRTVGVSVLTQSATHTIEGQGRIEASLINNGLVSSNDGAEMLLNVNDKTNNATMEAVNSSVLEIGFITITQSAAGNIVADGVDSQVELVAATIIGGDLISMNGGDIESTGTTALDGVSFSGDLNIINGSVVHLVNSWTNNGVVRVNSTAGGSTTTLDVDTSLTFNGTGTLDLVATGTRSRLRTIGMSVLTQSATHTIEGQGRIEAALINDGLVSANDGAQMLLVVKDKTNNAIIEAVNDSIMEINAITITQGLEGDIVADGVDSQIELVSATIIGGDLISMIDADIELNGTNTLNAVSFMGEMNIVNASTLHLQNTFANNGVMNLNSMNGGSTTTLEFDDSSTLTGNGTLKLVATSTRSRLRTAVGQVMTHGASHTIEGQGRVEANMINNGLISANVFESQMLLDVNEKTNNATMRAVDGAIMEINGITITQGAPGQIVADGAGSQIELVSATVVGGNLVSINNADIEVTGVSVFDAVDFLGMTIVPNANTLAVKLGTLNNGTIIVNSNSGGSTTSLRFDDEMILGGNGTIRLNSTSTRARIIPGSGVARAGIGSEQRLEGIGQIGIDLINDGTIAPGLSVGTMTANQPIFFAGIASYEAEVNGTTSDLLDSTSTIELHGTLDVLFVDGFAPTGFWSRTIMEGSEVTGKFDAINVPPAPSGLITRILNTGTEIIIGQTCQSDLNLDGALNFFDVSAFLNAFAAMDPAADLTGDGSWNFFDVSAFLNDFSVACPI